MLRSASKLLKNVTPKFQIGRTMTHYPIEDGMFGLTEEQIAVNIKIIGLNS